MQAREPAGTERRRNGGGAARWTVLALASAGGLGYIPVASGTWGTLAGIPLFFAFAHLATWSLWAYWTGLATVTLASCALAARAEVLLGEHDSHIIVIDEVVGYLAATIFLPPTWGNIVLAFFVFRALDIIKPWPAGWIDRRLSGGPGVVLDDVAAGIYTNLCVRMVWWLL